MSTSLEFVITLDTLTPYIDELVNSFEDKKLKALVKAGTDAWTEAQRLTQERLKRPGSYLQSFKIVVNQTEGSVSLINYHHAARIIEKGTVKKGYRIPREGEGLWFFKEGEWKWRPFVIHPGLDAKNIISEAMDKINPELLVDLKDLVGCP